MGLLRDKLKPTPPQVQPVTIPSTINPTVDTAQQQADFAKEAVDQAKEVANNAEGFTTQQNNTQQQAQVQTAAPVIPNNVPPLVQPAPAPIQTAKPVQSTTQPLSPNLTPVWQQKEPVQEDKPFSVIPQQEENKEPSVADRVKKGEDLLSIFEKYGKPVDHEAEFKRASRERNAALIGDIAALVGNTVGLSKGARIFNYKPANTDRANKRIETLKDMQRAENVDYANKKLSTAFKDFENKENKRRFDEKLQYEKNIQDAKNTQWSVDHQLKVDELLDKQSENKITHTEFNRQFEALQKQNEINNKLKGQQIGIDQQNANTNSYRAAATASKEHADKNQYIIGYGNEKFTYPKAAEGAISGRIYKLMQRETLKDPKRYGDMDDITLKTGEGGDVSSKTAAIVKRRLVDFPQLKGQVQQIISQFDGGNQPSSNRPAPKPSTKKGSLLPH